MRRITTLAAALLLAAGPALAGPLDGVWQTQPNDDGNFAHVRFAPCGAALCGTMIASYDKSGRPMQSKNDGKALVWDMQDAGGGAYQNGKIWDPGADKTYKSKMQLSGDRLKVSGCVGPFCKSQTWVRVK